MTYPAVVKSQSQTRGTRRTQAWLPKWTTLRRCYLFLWALSGLLGAPAEAVDTLLDADGSSWSPATTTTPAPLLECRATTKGDCLLRAPQPMTWSDAHAHCRSQDGFLPSKTHLDKPWPLRGSLTWTALAPLHGHYQWLSHCPANSTAPSQFVMWKERPELWSRDCSALNVSTGMFQLIQCSLRLPFVCVLSRPSFGADEIDYDDVELRVSGNVRGSHSWLKLDRQNYEPLTCVAVRKSTGIMLDPQPAVFWSKDGVYPGHCDNSIQPATVHDPTKSDSILPGISDKGVVSQGTVWCETWVPRSTSRITSNKVLVTLKDWLVLIFNAHVEEPPGRTVEAATKSLQAIFRPQFDNISNFIMDPISVVKRESLDGSKFFANYSFHLHIPKAELGFDDSRHFQIKSTTYTEIFMRNHRLGYLNSSHVAFPTFCLRHKEILKDGREIEWPFTEVGYVFPKNWKCRVKYGKLSPGVCMWNYTHGARIQFDPSECTWTDLCPEGYRTAAKNYCVSISTPNTWDIGFSATYKTSRENSVLDKTDFMKRISRRKSLYEVVQTLLNQSESGSKIWLPTRRKRLLSPLLFMGPNKTEFTLVPKKPISWESGHPRIDGECLALDTSRNSLQTLNCNAHLPFVAVVESNFLTERINRWPLLVKESKESPSCPPGWNTTVFKGKYETCFKLFTSNKNLTWPEAGQFCEDLEAQLPTPNVGFLDWVYRQHLFMNKVANVWMGVEWRNERLLYNGSEENLNWMADTDYSQPYGVLTQKGWKLQGRNEAKREILCQKISTPRIAMQLQVHEPKSIGSQTMCIDAEPQSLLVDGDYINPRCYVNGEFIHHERMEDSGCQYELKLSGQGYYQCQAWAHPPFSFVKSNVILHRDPATFTFVITLFQDKPYIPRRHDSSFLLTNRSNRDSDTCAEVFMANLRSTDLTDEFRFTDKNFFYFPSPAEMKLLHNFHLECEIKNTNKPIMTEKKLLKTLHEMLPLGKTFSDCTLLDLLSTQGCLRDVTEDFASGSPKQLTWPSTNGNAIVLPEQLCITAEGEPVTRECLGDFFVGYYWGPPSNNCTGDPSYITQELWKISINPQNLNESSTLTNLTANSTSLQPADIHFVAQTLDAFSKNEEISNFDLEDIVGIMNNVMAANETAFEPVQWKLNSSSTILEAFETMTFKVQLPRKKGDQAKNSSRELISVERLDLEINSTIIGYKTHQLVGRERHGETLMKGVNENELGDAEAAILLPSNLTFTVAGEMGQGRSLEIEEEKVQVTFAVYRNEKLFQENITNYTVNSHIIQATYRGKVVKGLQYPVKILFKPLKRGNDTKCVYWDFAKNDRKGGWSSDGCWPGEREENHDICYCNHLTCFAQLINYDENSSFEGPHAIILDIITITGCCLSVFGLLLVFTTFFLFKKWRRSLSNKILVNLSFSVFCSIVIFLAGIDQTWDVTLCRGVAVGLHYFILASFGWMLVEAVHQYLKFVKVVGTYIPRFLWKASVCAWGIPVLPILAVLVIDSSLYDYNIDKSNDVLICWMSVNAFKYAFLPPLALTMTVNLIMFSLIIHGAVCGRARVNSTMSERTLFMNQLRMAVCVFFLLGFTWIFGLLAIKEIRPVFSYLFCIFNTLQGFFIFLFHVCRERSARRMWRDFLSVLTKDPVSSSPGNSFNPVHSGHHRGHPDSVSFDKCGGILVLPRGPPIRSHLRSSHRTSLLSARTASTLIPSRASLNP
ncbi:uncharacterized protein LOC122266561 isoform X1 [Penaeus japonicus]|uniref:uncharacterized protein LOC122251190 isoform X1 n=1 Tax=Penaeus japonicus TaxID=27405 RepID=UPI001C70C10F|nr:uncharacterized protein LOC122251190 isoform X1 [Penaeus japonicus]XP_042892294.1 uncharacterized protein LOC122266561 isoform X1 [Penaeus japonicus]